MEYKKCFCSCYVVWIDLKGNDYNRNTCDYGGDCVNCIHGCYFEEG